MKANDGLKIKWVIEKRKLKDLKPHPKNPRILSEHDAKHLEKSLTKYGLIDKPIITRDGMIIGGHQRIAVLKKMGHKEIECYMPDTELDDQDINELNIRLNRNAGDWDYDILANEWDEEELLEFGFTEQEFSIGMNENEIDEKNIDESIVDGLDIMVKFTINIPNEDSTSFHNQLDELLKKFPRAKMEKKI